MITEIIRIEGMSCHHCVMAVNKELSKLDLIDKKVEIGKAEITYDQNKVEKNNIIQAIEEAGYKVVK